MAYNPISGFTLQVITSTGQVASDYYLKLYEANTTTPLSMATDSTGATLLTKAKIGDKGMPVSNPLDNSTVFIPHVNASYRLVIYTSESDADANNTAEAYVNVPFVSTLLGASGVGTAAYLNTGTAAGEVPTNADLGTVAYLDIGTGPGQVPRNDDLSTSIVGTATFSGDVYTFSPSGTWFRQLQAGMYLSFRLPGGSSNTTTTPVINYNGAIYAIKWINGSALEANDLSQAYNKQPILFYFDGTDMLIASNISGSNANGDWTKWVDGTQIASTLKTDAASITTPADGGFRTSGFAWLYPVAFLVAPRVLSQVINAFSSRASGDSGTEATYVYLAVSSQSSASRTIVLTAIGRWY